MKERREIISFRLILTPSQVKFISSICKKKVGTDGKPQKNLRSSKFAASSINNLNRFILSGSSLEVK